MRVSLFKLSLGVGLVALGLGGATLAQHPATVWVGGVFMAQAQVDTSNLAERTDRELRQIINDIRRQQRTLERAQTNLNRNLERQLRDLQRQLKTFERGIAREERLIANDRSRIERDARREVATLERDLARALKKIDKTEQKLENQIKGHRWLRWLFRKTPAEQDRLNAEFEQQRQVFEPQRQQLRDAHEAATEVIRQEFAQRLSEVEQRQNEVSEQRRGLQQQYLAAVELFQAGLQEELVQVRQQATELEAQVQIVVAEQQAREQGLPSPQPPTPQPEITSPQPTPTSTPAIVCGNGIIEVGEECDDGNVIAGDGCSPECEFEIVSDPAPPGIDGVEPVCGNGIVEDGEACDDGNAAAGDGCSAGCQVEQESAPEADPEELLVPENLTDNSDLEFCPAGGEEVAYSVILANLGINQETAGLASITEQNFLTWANQDSNDPSGDLTDLLATMRELDSSCQTGAISFSGINALLQTKFVTGLGWPLELSLGFSSDTIVDHSVIALSVSEPDSSSNYIVEALDPNGPQVVSLRCSADTTRGYVCFYPNASVGGQSLGSSAIPLIRRAAETQLTGLRAIYNNICANPTEQTQAFCNRKPIAGWLTTNFPDISESDLSGNSLSGNCSGWINFVSRVAFLGNFIGECSRSLGQQPAVNPLPLERDDSSESTIPPIQKLKLLPLPPTAFPSFTSECQNVATTENTCRVWPLGCSEQSFTCCEACQYDGADIVLCPLIGPKNYELICECPGGVAEVMFHRRDEFNKNPDCSLTIETFVLRECHDGENTELACPCAGTTVSCSGSEIVPARTCTIDALGNRFGDCGHIPARIPNPARIHDFNLLPEEAALSFVSIGEVLGASTQDAVVPELKPLEKVLNWFLYILGF